MSKILIRHAAWATAMSLALAFAFQSHVARATHGTQPETATQCDEGVIAEPVGINYAEHTTGCAISPDTDLDSFTFAGAPGDFVRFLVRATTSFFDPRLEIRDPDGILLHDGFCISGGGLCGFSIEPPDFNLVPMPSLEKSGTYQLTLSDQNIDGAGNYVLEIEKIPPVQDPPGVLYDITESDTISPSTDLDFFVFEGLAGTEIRINVTATTSFFDPRLEIRDPDGILLHDSFCISGGGLCGFSIEPPDFNLVPMPSLEKSGTYQLTLSDQNIDGAGNFDFSINCLFPAGACPDVVQPVVCEIVLSQSVYMDGDTVTADVLRFANPDSEAENTPIEWKVWLDRPSGAPVQIISVGDKGTIVLPPGAEVDLGPVPLLPVGPATELGDYALSCRLLEPATGRQKTLNQDTFEVQ